MERRSFCKLIAAAVAANAMPGLGQTQDSALPESTSGFNRLTRSYAEFCALPPEKRVFYKVSNTEIVETKLDEPTWEPSIWNYNPTASPAAGGLWDDVPVHAPVDGLAGDGPFQPNWDSLLGYEAPEWYQDAKFGIWAHWSPQCVPEQGDWYARNMYIQGTGQYESHVKTYGHPSRFGYKDICHLWKAEKWDPEALIKLYKSAGAQYFVALATHHDNFDCWNSKH